MKKSVITVLVCGISAIAFAVNTNAQEVNLSDTEFSLNEKVSIGYPTSCNTATVPTTPSGEKWTIDMSNGTYGYYGMGVFWRYSCGGKNILVMTATPTNDRYLSTCPESQIKFIQNGVEYTPTAGAITGGTNCIFSKDPHTMILYSSKVDIDQSFDVFYKNTGGAIGSFNAPAVSNSGSGIISNVSGIWWDSAYNGLGFNFAHTANSLFITHFGYAKDGQVLWLASKDAPNEIVKGRSYTFEMTRGTPGNGASFGEKPDVDNGQSKWGTMTLVLNSCTTGTLTLDGQDGKKQYNITSLAGLRGVTCTE